MQDRGPELSGVTGAFLAFSVVTVALRCYVRTRLTKSFGYDDWLIVVTLLLYIIYCSFVITGVRHGTGKHVVDLEPADYSEAMKMWYFCEIYYGLASTFTKLAAGTLLLRLTNRTSYVRVIWSVMIFAVVFGIAFEAQIIFQCHPISFFWSTTRDPLEGRCANPDVIGGFIYAHAAVASVGDWVFGILPIFMFRGLNMNRRAKISVILILCLANIGSIATIVRIRTIYQITTSQDFLFETIDLAIWSSIEIGTAIPAISIAALRPLFRTFFSTGTVNRTAISGPIPAGSAGARYVRAETPLELQEAKRAHAHGNSQTSTTRITGGRQESGNDRRWADESRYDDRCSENDPWRIKQDVEISYTHRRSDEDIV